GSRIQERPASGGVQRAGIRGRGLESLRPRVGPRQRPLQARRRLRPRAITRKRPRPSGHRCSSSIVSTAERDRVLGEPSPMKILVPLLTLLCLREAAAVPAPEDKTDLAIRRAVGYLTTQQDKDGAIQTHFQWANRTAMTALSLMA